MSNIDEIDRAIVDCLMRDGRMPAAEIARRVGGISGRTVRYRLERLVAEDLIRIGAIPNAEALGYPVVADVIIQVEAGRVGEVARRLANFEFTSYVGCSMGERDVSVQILARDNEELYSLVTEVVAKVPGVVRTTTLIVPLVLKDVYQWRIPKSALSDQEPYGGEVPLRAKVEGGG
jgi:Lrp/AsnC family transcriptional regulator for asnA, asnC and gidA